MAFKDNLRQASIGGIPFFVQAHDHTTGRRTATHVYPYQDTPFVEDLGRQARTWTVQGHVIADDFDLRDRLIKRIEAAGPLGSSSRRGELGTVLVHPYMGVRRVIVQSFRLRESTTEGRISRFELQVIETGAQIFPFRTRSGSALVDNDADALDTAVSASVGDRLDALGSQEVRDSMSGEVTKLAGKIGALDVFSGPTGDVSALSASLRTLTNTASSLATAPADLVAEVVSTIVQVRAGAANAVDALAAYEILFDLTPDLLSGVSSTVVQANANAQASNDLMRTAAVSGAARAMARVSWETRSDAVAARNRTLEVIDALATSQPDELLVPFGALRRTISETVPPRNSSLPRVGSFTPTITQPSLVLAYRLHADRTRSDQIVQRNSVKHPGFLPGGVELEVLVDA